MIRLDMTFIVIFISLSFAQAQDATQVRPPCVDGKFNLQNACQTFAQSKEALIKVPGGGLIMNPFVYDGDSAEALKAQEKLRAPLSENEIKDAEEEFGRIKQAALTTLLHGRKLEDLSKEESYLYTRLSTVGLNVIASEPDVTNKCSSDGGVPIQDAGYVSFLLSVKSY